MHTFVDPLYRAQRLFANRVAVINGDVHLTYMEMWSRCRRLAGLLMQLGIQPGERVAMLALNSHQYLDRLGNSFLRLP
jgi:fatty-acyl-CoA synthase